MLARTNPPAQAMPEQSCRASCPSIAQAMPYERNGRTHVTTTHLSSYLTLRTARRGVAKISAQREKASATRGHTGAPNA